MEGWWAGAASEPLVPPYLMLKQKLVHVDDGPAHVFKRLQAIFFAGNVLAGGVELGVARAAAKRGKIQLRHHLVIGLLRVHKLAEAVVAIPQLLVHQRAVIKLQGLAEIRFTRPLAGTDGLPLGLAKDLEELVFRHVWRRELRGFRPRGERPKFFFDSRYVADGIQQLLGREQSRLVVRAILGVIFVEGVGARRG